MSRLPRPHESAAHLDRPSDVAAHIASESAVVVSGPDSDRSATFAVAIARAAASGRRVAIGDLVGESAPIYALAGGEDAPGITDCFRDGLPLTEIARPVPEVPSLFVLPAGARVRTEESLTSSERWGKLVRGFGEAEGLLVLVVPDQSRLLLTLGEAGAVLLYGGPADHAPPGIRLSATIGAALPPPLRKPRPGEVAGWQLVAAALGVIAVAGGGAVVWTRAANAPDGSVVVAPARRAELTPDPAVASAATPITVDILERTSADDAARSAPFVVQLVAADAASNAISLLMDASRDGALPAATISVVAVRGARGGPGESRMTRWHKVMAGAWPDARTADSVIAELRTRGVLRKGEGQVIRAPYGVLLADSASRERARAVMDVWRAKGVTPYALTQADESVRVYVGAFETVAQAATMTAMVQAAGGAPIVAYRTGRPD